MNENEKKIATFFIEREGQGIVEKIRDIDFLESGIIDSLDLVSLAVHIEKNFKIKLDLADPTIFNSARRFDSIVALVEKNLK